MDFQTGSLTLQQDFGRLQLSASATANKYWMPMQSTLYTQYSFSGSAAYSISEAVTLHAYGQYYANNPIVGPAFSPYVSTTTYGAYADIRFSDRFGLCRHSLQRPLWLEYWCTSLHQSHVGPVDYLTHCHPILPCG